MCSFRQRSSSDRWCLLLKQYCQLSAIVSSMKCFFSSNACYVGCLSKWRNNTTTIYSTGGVQGLRSWRTEALSNSWQKRIWFWIESKSRWNKSTNWKDWAAILNLPFPHYLLAVGLTQLGVGLPNDTTVPWRWMKVDAGVDQLYDEGGSEQKPWLTAGHQSSQRPITGRICREVLVFANLWTTCGNCCCDEVSVYIYWSHHLNVEILQISE